MLSLILLTNILFSNQEGTMIPTGYKGYVASEDGGVNSITHSSVKASTVWNASFKNNEFMQHINAKVIEVIENADTVPGLKDDVFKSLREGIRGCWNDLYANGVIEITATDAEVRPYFVALQGIIEHVLSNELGKTVDDLTGVIHTPMPATPLCTAGKVSKDLVDPTIEEDPSRLFTVKARTTILRDYLDKKGRLYVVYPEEGMIKRTQAQQEIYKQELKNYPVHLIDNPMRREKIQTIVTLESDVEIGSDEKIESGIEIGSEQTGAFYVFKNKIQNYAAGENAKQKQYVFAIKMSQANNPQDSASFGLWFGESKAGHPAYERMVDVLNFVQHYVKQSIIVH